MTDNENVLKQYIQILERQIKSADLVSVKLPNNESYYLPRSVSEYIEELKVYKRWNICTLIYDLFSYKTE